MIKVNVVHSLIDTNEEILNEYREFSDNEKSIKYLENIEKNKMQIIFDHLNLGKYAKRKILKNANSVYSNSYFSHSAVCRKTLYSSVAHFNNIKTVVNIETI